MGGRRGGGGGGGAQTVGYWYGCGMHMVFCHGPVDEVSQIWVGERLAWAGTLGGNWVFTINEPTLFGGEDREGGVQGEVALMFGAADQGQEAYLQARMGTANIPAWRGVLSLVLRQVWLAAMNPYIKPWALTARRLPGLTWYNAKANIDGDANPAHLIRECLTNADWGMGYPVGELDDAAFRAAADTLHGESFGLSLLWSREETIENFVLGILKQIDGVLYVHPRTGLFVLKLARADYDPAALPLFDSGNILRLEEFARPAWGETTNQVTVTYRDRATDKEASHTVQDVAMVNLTGGVVAATVDCPGISNATLAHRVAMRELKQLSNPLAKVVFIANRAAASLNIGDVIQLTWSPYGIQALVLRVARLSYGELGNGAVRVECLQDVFGLPMALYAAPPPSGWVDPVSAPAPCPYQTIYEIPYWTVVMEIVGQFQSLLSDIDDLDGMAAVCGARPASDAFGYRLRARLGSGSYADDGDGVFCPTAILAAALPQAIAQAVVTLQGGSDLAQVEADTLAMIDSELVKVVSLSGATLTIERGVLDTVPVSHVAGARIWFIDAGAQRLSATYVSGDTVQAKLLTRTGKGTLAEGSAPQMQVVLNRRFIRSYCPGNLRINNKSLPAAVAGETLTITWANRNRQTQTAYLVLQSEGNIAPEAGQTTSLYLYGETGSLKHEYTGLTGASQVWSTEIADSGLGRINDRVTVEIESWRDGNPSWQKQRITCDRAGYGLRYGQYYGGA